MPGRRHDLETVIAGRDQREAEHARREAVYGAAGIGDRLAGDHLGGIRAHAVVADHLRGSAARGDQAHARAVHRRTGACIEHEAIRIDQRLRARGVGRIAAVGVGRGERGVALDLQHAIAGVRRGGARLDIADELTGVRAGFAEPHPLVIAARGRHLGFDHVDHGGVEVLVGVGEAQEERLAAVHDGRR